MQSQCPSYSLSPINFGLHDHTYEVKSLCRNLGRIRRRRSMTKERKDSNLLSIEISQIKIIHTSLLRMNTREKTPLEKGEEHQSNVGDVKKITCTRISHTEKKE
jgi:hypothetical protein